MQHEMNSLLLLSFQLQWKAFFLGRSFSRKDEPQTRNTRPAAFTSLMQLEQLQVARAPFFLIAMKSLFFGAVIFLGLPRHVFSRKDEPQTRNTRPAAFTSLMLLEQSHATANWTSCAHCWWKSVHKLYFYKLYCRNSVSWHTKQWQWRYISNEWMSDFFLFDFTNT